MPPGRQVSHRIVKSPKHVCRWHTGCGKRFYSRRQLFRHLEEEHGLNRGGKVWRTGGYGARLRRRDARDGDEPLHGDAVFSSTNPYDLSRYRNEHSSFRSDSSTAHAFPAATWYGDSALTSTCDSSSGGLASIQAPADRPPSPRVGSQPPRNLDRAAADGRSVSFRPAEMPPSGRAGDPPHFSFRPAEMPPSGQAGDLPSVEIPTSAEMPPRSTRVAFEGFSQCGPSLLPPGPRAAANEYLRPLPRGQSPDTLVASVHL